MSRVRPPIELITLCYIVSYIPYIALTRWLSSTVLPGFAAPLKGLEIIPSTMIMTWVTIWVFFYASGWWKSAHQLKLGSIRLPRPTLWTFLSAVGTALILVTVPLSFTFKGVSIPFVQLLMRGDILLVAPVVDLLNRRRVRWYSWIALALTAAGLFVAVYARGGLELPLLCWITIGLYTFGYFLRLAVMTRVAKSGAPGEMQGYYVEEQIFATPLGLGLLALLSAVDVGGMPSAVIRRGFVEVWTSAALAPLAAIAFFLFVVSVLAASILLDRRENSYCVPLERSASILAGIAAAYILSAAFGQKPPTQAEMIGAVLLIAAITVLALGPRLGGRGARTGADLAPERS